MGGKTALCLLLFFALALPFAGAFSDVPDTAWCAQAVQAVPQKGWMNGNDEDSFSPDQPLLLCDAAAIASCILPNGNTDAILDAYPSDRYTSRLPRDAFASLLHRTLTGGRLYGRSAYLLSRPVFVPFISKRSCLPAAPLFFQGKDALHRLTEQPRHLHGKFERRVVFIVFHCDNRLPRYPQQVRHVLLPQAARLAQFFDAVLHIIIPITP